MKAGAKLIFILFFLFISISLLAQDKTQPPADDEEFNLFLFSLLAVFMCAMVGAAIIGAAAATLMVLFLFALLAFGILSASVAVGLYKRSFSAGFKTLLVIFFGAGGTLIGGVGAVLANHYLHLELSRQTAAVTGVLAGLCGGILMAIASFQVFQFLIRTLSQKLRLV